MLFQRHELDLFHNFHIYKQRKLIATRLRKVDTSISRPVSSRLIFHVHALVPDSRTYKPIKKRSPFPSISRYSILRTNSARGTLIPSLFASPIRTAGSLTMTTTRRRHIPGTWTPSTLLLCVVRVYPCSHKYGASLPVRRHRHVQAQIRDSRLWVLAQLQS